MMSAPFHDDLAEAPVGGDVHWCTTSDGLRLRVGLWASPQARATILLLPGRTEFIEKYGRVISKLVEHDFGVAVIDWRGQGYSDRLTEDPAMGHVNDFADYQLDLKALIDATQKAGFPQSFHILAHSMGGNIALRAMINGLNIQSAVFSAPMWGILIPKAKRLQAAMLPKLAQISGKGLNYLPETSQKAYICENGFEDNLLTTDPDHYEYFSRLSSAAPELALGGPSIHWFAQAMAECSALATAPRPDVPVRTFLGSLEGIVDAEVIRKMHKDWETAQLTEIEGARHELMMEAGPARDLFFEQMFAFLGAP